MPPLDSLEQAIEDAEIVKPQNADLDSVNDHLAAARVDQHDVGDVHHLVDDRDHGVDDHHADLDDREDGYGHAALAEGTTALAQHSGNGSAAVSVGRVVELLPAATIKPERTEYVWDGRIVAGDLNLLVGPPGVGKGATMMHVAARLTRGDLDGDLKGTPAAVIISSAEDSPAHAIVPRLLAAGADMDLVFIVRVTVDDAEDGLTLPDDVPSLAALVKDKGAALVIVDPLAAHLSGKVDSHKDASIRRALAPLARMAHETGAAVLAVAHTNKAAGSDWVRRVGGSVGLGAAARNVLIAADDPDGDDRIIAHAKSNTGALAAALRYRVEGREIEYDDETIATCGVAWLGVAEGVTAADVLADHEPEERTEREEAGAWLVSYLEEHGGAASAGDCITAAARDGISKTTLHRARKAAGIDTGKRGLNGEWVWTLQDSTAPQHVERGILESSSETPDCDAPEDSTTTEDSTFHGTGGSESSPGERPTFSKPGQYAGLPWQQELAARLRGIRERDGNADDWGDDV